MRVRLLGYALYGAVAAIALNPTSPLVVSHAYASHSVREEVGEPINSAREKAQGGHYREALAELSKADSVGDKTSYETYVLELTRGSIAQQAGQLSVAQKSYEAVLGTDEPTPDLRVKLTQAVAQIYYQQQDWADFITWTNKYFKAGGDDSSMRDALVGAYYQNNDFAQAEKISQKEALASVAAGQKPSQQTLQIWESSAHNLNDDDSFRKAVSLVVTYYPTAQDWQNLLIVTSKADNFPDRLSLDVERLQFAVGTLTAADDLMTAAQDAVQAGLPGEAKSFIDAGFAAGTLGTGPDAARQNRLKALVESKVAEDQRTLATGAKAAEKASSGDGLVNVGFSYVSYGEFDKGIPMMEEGISKGNLKHPGTAQLHLGIAYLKSGDKDKAIEAFKAVDDTDGTPDLAKLWIIEANKSS